MDDKILNVDKVRENIEKYKEMCGADTHPAMFNGRLVPCSNGKWNCEKCDLDNMGLDCNAYFLRWLFSEYKEPQVDWTKVEVDTPIYVKNEGYMSWDKRHFARYEKGLVYAWVEGKTSFSALTNADVYSWDYAKLKDDSVFGDWDVK